MSKKVLVIEDDAGVRDLLAVHIREIGCEPEFASDGSTGLALALENDYAVLLLDLNLPVLPGLEVCRELRKKREDLPIIILSSKGSEVERVVGLEIGADDYVTKPFSIHELIARLKVQLRRSARKEDLQKQKAGSSDELVSRFDDLEIDLGRRIVQRAGKPVSVTAKEFDLLAFLSRQPGRPFTREQLLLNVWGVHAEGYEKNVNSLITRLRKKLEDDPARPRFIRTYHSVGYAFVDPMDAPPEFKDPEEIKDDD